MGLWALIKRTHAGPVLMFLAALATMMIPSSSWAQDEPRDAKELITTYASTIAPYLLEDQMRELARTRREEALQAFGEILAHLEEYPEWVLAQQVLGAMVKHCGDEEPRRIFTAWLLTTDSERFAEELRHFSGWEPFTEPEWLREVYQHAASHAASQLIRHALVTRLGLELTGDELEAYLRSDEGLHTSLERGLWSAWSAVNHAANGRQPAADLEPALQGFDRVLTYHGEHYDICHLHRAMFLWFFDRDEEALADLEAYVARHPDAPYPHHMRARILRETGDEAGAQAAEQMYREKTEALRPLEIEVPELPEELPQTDLQRRDIPGLVEHPDPGDVPRLAQAVASANADLDTVHAALRALNDCFSDEELIPATPWLELALGRRVLPSAYFMARAARLLGRAGQPSSAPIIAELACDERWRPTGLPQQLTSVLAMFPEEIAKHHLLWVALKRRDVIYLSFVESFYPPEKKYWQAHWELIVAGRPDERLAAAATDRDLLGSLTLYEMATDPSLEPALREQALEALRQPPAHPLANLVEVHGEAGE
jgi:hypothetical protein